MNRDLLQWFDQGHRSMPWRDDPNPYYVWISEIMLQQTRVHVVIPYFKRFIETLPTVHHLAAIDDEKLMLLWQGLGYYSRAMNLKKSAQIILEKYAGHLPKSKDELLTLPGIGEYTAGAIASIAFGQKEAAVDGNVLRVFTRLLADNGDITKVATKKRVTEAVMKELGDRPGDFNQALMELGALVCLPKNPKCEICPIAHHCKAKEQGTQESFPVKPKKKEAVHENKTVFVLRTNGQTMISKRPEEGLLKKLWQFPIVDGHMNRKDATLYLREEGYDPLRIKKGPSYKHIFSHRIWNIHSYIVDVAEMVTNHHWIVQDELSEYAIPSAFSKILEYIEHEK